jgi:hypothetical protein
MKATLLERMTVDPNEDFEMKLFAPLGGSMSGIMGDRVEIVVVAVSVDNDDVVRAALEAALPEGQAITGRRVINVGG